MDQLVQQSGPAQTSEATSSRRPRSVSSSGFRLTQHDREIVKAVQEYSGLTTGQIQRRFFPSKAAYSTTCSHRLGQLVKAGYLRVAGMLPVTGRGSGHQFFLPGTVGRKLLAEVYGLPRAELKNTRLVSPFLLNHHKDLVDCRLALQRACTQVPVLQVEEWVSDRQWHQTGGLLVTLPESKKTSRLVPDGAFTLTAASDGSRHPWLLEYDRASIPCSRWLIRYQQYLALPPDETDGPITVLIVTTNQHRIRHLLSWSLEAREAFPGPSSTLFRLTTKDYLDSRNWLTDPIIWPVGASSFFPLASIQPYVRYFSRPGSNPNG